MKKVGILGGGQLGRMLCQAAIDLDIETWVLDEGEDFPAAKICSHFVKGSFSDYKTVYNFGKKVEVLTIEIEHVNTEALLQLEKEGVKVYPSAKTLNLIKDKGIQKEFYKKNEIPTAPFLLYANKEAVLAALKKGDVTYPFVQKLRTSGYDGKGVAVINNEGELKKLLEGACVVEEKANILQEIAILCARNAKGEIAIYDAVQMWFDEKANLLSMQVCPAIFPHDKIEQKAYNLAKKVTTAFNVVGLLAIELFITKEKEIWVNEVAPRPHNSGHHTIEGCVTSQFQQLLRAILDLPLGPTDLILPSAMINLLGEPDHNGKVKYEGLYEALNLTDVYVHLYGKKTTKPFRKMGHVTILDKKWFKAVEKAKEVQKVLKVKSS